LLNFYAPLVLDRLSYKSCKKLQKKADKSYKKAVEMLEKSCRNAGKSCRNAVRALRAVRAVEYCKSFKSCRNAIRAITKILYPLWEYSVSSKLFSF